MINADIKKLIFDELSFKQLRKSCYDNFGKSLFLHNNIVMKKLR